jgi:RNA polymerase sigma-70 factor (TIGR02943 family)
MDATISTATVKSWVDQYSDSMYSWAFHKTSSRETAEDLVQDTFLAAFQSFEKFKGDSNPRTWLFSILNNKINDHYRHTYRQPKIEDNSIFETFFDSNLRWKTDQRPQQWTEETGDILDDDEFQKILHYCMKNLPVNWSTAIQLKFMEEKKGEHICQELGITDTNFWQILHRAKLQLRKCLELNWFNIE